MLANKPGEGQFARQVLLSCRFHTIIRRSAEQPGDPALQFARAERRDDEIVDRFRRCGHQVVVRRQDRERRRADRVLREPVKEIDDQVAARNRNRNDEIQSTLVQSVMERRAPWRTFRNAIECGTAFVAQRRRCVINEQYATRHNTTLGSFRPLSDAGRPNP